MPKFLIVVRCEVIADDEDAATQKYVDDNTTSEALDIIEYCEEHKSYHLANLDKTAPINEAIH